MDHPGPNDRRKDIRVNEEISVSVKILDPPDNTSLTGQSFKCYTKDISFQGICLVSNDEIPPFSKLELILEINNPSGSFTFTGISMWCICNNNTEIYEIGIQLMHKSEIPLQWKEFVISLLTED